MLGATALVDQTNPFLGISSAEYWQQSTASVGIEALTDNDALVTLRRQQQGDQQKHQHHQQQATVCVVVHSSHCSRHIETKRNAKANSASNEQQH